MNKTVHNSEHSSLNKAGMARTPDIFCLVRGASEGATRLNAFDNALLNAGVGDTNLMRVSSILPPAAIQVEIKDMSFPKGCFLPLAYASINSTSSGQLISSAVAVGIPKDESEAGVIMEFEDHARLDEVEATARRMVEHAFDKRGRGLKQIRSLGIEHHVEACAAAFAAVVLWYDDAG